VALLLALVLAPACGRSGDDSSQPLDPLDKRRVVARVPDADVATVRSYLQAKLRDPSLADSLGVKSFDKAFVTLHSAAEKEVWVRAIRELAAGDPALEGVDLATVKLASVYFREGGGPWLLVIVDPETGRPLTVVRMN
jgi:hypothetical protein